MEALWRVVRGSVVGEQQWAPESHHHRHSPGEDPDEREQVGHRTKALSWLEEGRGWAHERLEDDQAGPQMLQAYADQEG